VKKQEAYHNIFLLLIDVRKYVSHQVGEFEEWAYINQYHPYIQNMNMRPELEAPLKDEWERDKKAYKEKSKSPANKKEAEKLKVNYEKSISKLFDLIDIQSIYLSSDVEDEIMQLKKQISTTHEYEDWDEHFTRISSAASTTIDKIREVSKKELKIGI